MSFKSDSGCAAGGCADGAQSRTAWLERIEAFANPEGLVDLTTSDATKAFSVLKPNAKDWLDFNADVCYSFDNEKPYLH